LTDALRHVAWQELRGTVHTWPQGPSTQNRALGLTRAKLKSSPRLSFPPPSSHPSCLPTSCSLKMSSRWEKISRVFLSVPKLQGKENWVEWDMRIKVALGIVGLRSLLAGRPALTSEAYRKAWEGQDTQVANSIIDCTDFSISSAYFYPLEDAPTSSRSDKSTRPAPHQAT
jgi:hypothetical protein